MAFSAVVIAGAAITIAISAAVYWRARKGASLSFGMQRNKAYDRTRRVAAENTTAVVESNMLSYSYPMVNMEANETASNDVYIDTRRNAAYSTMTEPLHQHLEGVTCTAAAQIPASVGNKTGTADAELVNTYATISEDVNHTYCYITDLEKEVDRERTHSSENRIDSLVQHQ